MRAARGNAASKLWRIGYRFHSRQKTYSIGPYGNGKDGAFSLADARRERDKAKDLLKEGKDPSTEQQLDKQAVGSLPGTLSRAVVCTLDRAIPPTLQYKMTEDGDRHPS
jgi:hypothetical protein